MRHLSELSATGLAAVCLVGFAGAQQLPSHHAHAAHTAHQLTQPGQSAFGALSEVVEILQNDPSTDWSTIDITRLRDHLVDMDEVVMRAEAHVEQTGDAVRIIYVGSGRTLAAIQRMIPAHAGMMNGYNGWKSSSELQSNGAVWRIAAISAQERTKIRALGAFGLLTLGTHHGPHHLAMARGATGA